ncbi:MAG: hypothetical protein ABI233_00180 [Chthoniobacterales bacterium]
MKLPLLLPAFFTATLGFFLAAPVHGQSSPGPSPHINDAQSRHHEGVDERGDKGMGFSHQLTGHHFYLYADGGAIAVAANNPADTASRDAIRTHLASIARMFSEGNFAIPMFVHDTAPPGIETMKQLRKDISYVAEPNDSGARVTIRTSNPKAVEAIHDFLRFQITEHRTGDTLEVKK